MPAILNAGGIVAEKTIAVDRRDSWFSLKLRAKKEGVSLTRVACERIADGAFEPVLVPPEELGRIHTTPNFRQWFRCVMRVARRRLFRA